MKMLIIKNRNAHTFRFLTYHFFLSCLLESYIHFLKCNNISIIGVATRYGPEVALIEFQNSAAPSVTRFFHGRLWPSTWELKHERDNILPHPFHAWVSM